MVAKKLVSDRLDFKGEPCFDPSPFLDDTSRGIFQRPIDHALRPGEATEDPPRVRVFGSDEEVWKLLEKLDKSGRLGALRECDVLEGFQAGLFAVGKSSAHDRLIFDSRPFNTLESLERPMHRWIGSMGAASSLCDLHIGEDSVLRTSGTDLREFYYSFSVSEQRLRRNSLLISVAPEQLRGFRCYDPAFEQEGRPVYLGLRTLAMGDSMAVELVQTAHLGILIQMELVDESTLLSMDLPAPRGNFFAGVVIDDLILFEVVAKTAVDVKPGLGSSKLSAALHRYKELGLMVHEGKTFHDNVEAEFWGAHVEGHRGFVRANLKKVIPILFATLGVLKLGVCTISLLEVLVGCWTSIFLFKRRMLSLLNICYEALQRQVDSREVIRLSQGLKDELLLCVCLVPLATTYIKARDSSFIYESDASTWGWAVCRAELPAWLRSEIHRHRLRKSVWSRLLSPLKSLQRIKGILPAADELPGDQCLASHPLHIELGSCLQFVELEKRKSSQDIHINVLELRGMVHSEKAAAFEHFPGRSFSLSDSQVSIGAWLKGRSSSVALNQELQQSLPVHLGCGMVSNCGYIPSEVNATDDPTRHVAVRPPEKVPELWMDTANFVDVDAQLEAFDIWLKSYGADPYSISGLPDMQELRVPLDDESSSLSHSQLFFKKKKAAARNRKSEVEKVPSENVNSINAPLEKSGDKDFSYPDATSLTRKELPDEAKKLLATIPRERFLLPRHWQVSPTWRPNFAGYLDLYSGKKGVARMLVSFCEVWALTFETSDDESQDVLAAENKKLIEDLLKLGCCFGFGAAIFCGSFSRAVRPAVRDKDRPYGLPNLTANMFEKVSMGNHHAIWLAGLIDLCRKYHVFFWVENPDGSFLWSLDEWVKLGAKDPSHSMRVDYCAFGCAWRKRTRIFTNTHLQEQRLFCSRDHTHRKLVGWSRAHRAPWTRVAQVYPRKLCWIISTAVLRDAGLLPTRRKICLSMMCRCKNRRIGEASNPGPRKKKVMAGRDVLQLDQAELVEPVASVLAARVWQSFRLWCLADLSESSFVSLAGCSSTLSLLVEAFGRDLYRRGDSIYVLRQLVTLIQRWKPEFKPSLGSAWQLISKWESLEPIKHRSPPAARSFPSHAGDCAALGLASLCWNSGSHL